MGRRFMICIYTAQNIVEAEAVKHFLESKGVRVHYDEPVALGFNSPLVQIFIDPENDGLELRDSLKSFLQSFVSSNKMPEENGFRKIPTKSSELSKYWSPFQAVLLYVFVMYPGGLVTSFLLGDRWHFDPFPLVFGQLAVASLLIVRKRQPILSCLSLEDVSARKTFLWILITVIWFFALTWSFYQFQFPYSGYIAKVVSLNSDLHLVSLILLTPVIEEVLFRGFLYKCFEEKYPIVGIFVVSLLWASVQNQFNIYEFIALYLSGLIFNLARYKTGSTIPAIFMHMTFNILVAAHHFVPQIFPF